MMRWLCWLFWSCATPAPVAPPPPAPPPQVAAEPHASPGDTNEVEDAAAQSGGVPAADSVQTDHPKPPEATMPVVPPPPAPAASAPELPAWERFAVPAPPALGRPTISVVIDDMGVNVVQSARAIALPGPLTLSWLPYAPHLAEQIAAGEAHGDEMMLHMPMEALGKMNPGPHALRTWLPPATNLAYLRAALDLVPTAVALNQHEGSVASLSVPLMDLVMSELKARHMAFLDSRTIPHGVALARARAEGLAAVGRDLFIDNDPNPAAIRARLAEVEGIARRNGHAILIGHPRVNTMDVLAQYLPTVEARGFVLWPISATIAAETQIQVSAAPAAVPRQTALREGAIGEAEGAVAPARPSGAE